MANRDKDDGKQKVSDVMTADPECVQGKDSVRDAARIMKSRDTGVVPVVDGKKIIGMITDRDIVVRGIAEGKDAGNARVDELMTKDVKCVRDDSPVSDALELMSKSEIRRLGVVNASDEIVGILSIGDIASDTKDSHKVGRAMEEISEAPPNN